MNTYHLTLTLELDAVNERSALRLARLIGGDIEHGRRRPGSPGSSGITHAWMGTAKPAIEWCEQAACPRKQCVECQRFPVGARVVEIAYPDSDWTVTGHADDGWTYARSALTGQTLSFAPHELTHKETT